MPSGEDRQEPRPLLALTYVIAVLLRAVHAALTDPVFTSRGDNTFFVATARSIATGHIGRLPTLAGTRAMSVKFPPLWPWTLGLGQRVLWFLSPSTSNTVWSIVIGASVAPLVGLLAWRLFDRLPASRRRLVSGGVALLAAAHPLLLGATSSLMSEVLVVPLSLGILLGVERVQHFGPEPRRLVGIGAMVALAALVRPEALLMWFVVLGAMAFVTRRWAILVLPVLVAVVPVLTFSAVASRAAGTPVLVSTSAASAVAGANCDATWSGQEIGHWSKRCLGEVWLGRIPSGDRQMIYGYEQLPLDRFPRQLGPRLEGQLQSAHRRGALYAIRRHPILTVRAVPVRVARGLGLWWSPGQTRLEVAEGRVRPWELAGRWVHLLLVLPAFVLGAAGALQRRGTLAELAQRCVDRRRLLPFAVALAVWAFGLAATEGSTRHRSAVDGIFLLGAALGYAMLIMRRVEDPLREPVDASSSRPLVRAEAR